MTNRLKKVEDVVRKYLIAYPDARNSDDTLYYFIFRDICEQSGVKMGDISAKALLLNKADYGFPKFETIRRSRQKVQAMYPELKANKEVQEAREALQDEWKEWALL